MKEAPRGANASKTPLKIYLFCALGIALILSVDMSIPLGVAMGVPYIAIVWISLWSPAKRFTVAVAILCSLLTIARLFLKPPVDEMWKSVFNRVIAISAIGLTAWLGLQRKVAEERRERIVAERKKALEDVRILRGFLPICASCKKIRDVSGYWTQIEQYIRENSEADFSHSICPDCMKKLYPEYAPKDSETGRLP